MKILTYMMPLFLFHAPKDAHSTDARLRETITVDIEIQASPQAAFAYILPVDLAHIFRGYKNLPAVTRTSNQEKWCRSGMQRTVYFEDGSSAKERLTAVHSHAAFSYHIDGFSSSLRNLAHHIEGNWKFTEVAEGQTHISWSYTVVAHNLFSRFLIAIFVKQRIRKMLENALGILKADLEQETKWNG